MDILNNCLSWLRYIRSPTREAIINANIDQEQYPHLAAILIAMVDNSERRWRQKAKDFGDLDYQPVDIGFRSLLCLLSNHIYEGPVDRVSYSIQDVSSVVSRVWSTHEKARGSMTHTQVRDFLMTARESLQGDTQTVTMKYGELIAGRRLMAKLYAGTYALQIMADYHDNLGFSIHLQE